MGKKAIKAAASSAMRKALDSLEHGPDSAVKVGQWVRALASIEARDGGEFASALQMKDAGAWGSFGRETFGSLYGLGVEEIDPTKTPAGAEWIRELLAQAESLPEWQALQERARGDGWAAGMAAAGAMEVLAPTIDLPAEDPQEIQDEIDMLEDLSDGNMTSAKHLRRMSLARKRYADAVAKSAQALSSLRSKAATVRSALRGAANAASEAVDEERAAMAAMGGDGTGVANGSAARVSVPRAELRAALRKNDKLRRVAILAGRLKARAVMKQATKARVGREEVCDVTVGDDLSRLLPSEMVLAGDPDLELLLFRRLFERSALVYHLRSPENRTQGPIVLLVDESGSMSGQRDEWSKAVAMALIEIAARQKRSFAFVHFDTSVSRIDRFDDPRALDFEKLIDMISHFTGGGTSIATALKAGVDLIAAEKESAPFSRADLVVISDGDDWDTVDQIAQLKRAHELGISTFGIGIGQPLGAELSAELTDVTEILDADLDGTAAGTSKIDAVLSM